MHIPDNYLLLMLRTLYLADEMLWQLFFGLLSFLYNEVTFNFQNITVYILPVVLKYEPDNVLIPNLKIFVYHLSDNFKKNPIQNRDRVFALSGELHIALAPFILVI